MNSLRSEQLSVFTALFSCVDEALYASIAAAPSWQLFCAALPQELARYVADPLPIDDYLRFVNQVLTPGLPGSLPPVESLYKDWAGHTAGIQHGAGYYLGDSARHVQAVCDQLGIQIPREFHAMPDHIVLLLELHEYLREHAPVEDVRDFARHHFDWLVAYRSLLKERSANEADVSLARSAAFYAGLTACVEDFVFAGNDYAKTNDSAHAASHYIHASAEEVVLQ